MRIVLLLMSISLLLGAKSFEQAFNVKLISPKMKTISFSKDYYAKTSYDKTKLYLISSKSGGYVKKLYVDDIYSKVTKNSKLFSLEPMHINELKSEYEYYDDTLKPLLEARVLDDGLDIDILFDDSKTRDVFSEYSGVVIEKNIEIGSHIKRGDVLYKLVDDRKVWVIAKIYQRDIALIKKGMSATIKIDGLDQTFHSKVAKIYPHIDSDDLSFDVRLELDNSKGEIFFGMAAKISIDISTKTALFLPKDAIVSRDDKLYVFIKNKNGEFEPQEVKAVLKNGIYEILSGVDEQSLVAQNALFLLDSDAISSGAYKGDEW